MEKNKSIVKEDIAQKIYTFRNTKVMLDSDLSELYGITVSALNQAVKRNMDRFPEDFMFQLTPKEFEILKSQFVISSLDNSSDLPVNTSNNENLLRSQFVTSSLNKQEDILRSQFVTANPEWSKKRFAPYAFTEQGVAMLSGVLKSESSTS